jgi:hypothetical protein
MKINLKKISNIKSKKDLKDFNLGEPIFLENYLFHYLILFDNLKGLKLFDFPVYKNNVDDYNGFQLAAFNEIYEILDYLIEKYPDYIYNVNSSYNNFLHYLDPSTNYYLKILKNKSIDNQLLLYNVNSNNLSCLDLIFEYGSYKNIIEMIKIGFDINNFEGQPSFFLILNNGNLSDNNIINILKELEKKYDKLYELIDVNLMNFSWLTFGSRKLKIINHIIDKIELNITLPITSYNIFRSIYATDEEYGNFQISKLVWNKIKDRDDIFNKINMYGDNLAHFILDKSKYGRTDLKFEKEILGKCKDCNWNEINLEKNTPVHFLVLLDFDKYNSIIKNKKINVKIKNENNETSLDLGNKRWSNILKKLNNYDLKVERNNVKLNDYKYSHGNLYSATFLDLGIFAKIMNKKYKQLYLPSYIETENINTWDGGLSLPDPFLENYLNFPWLIIWNRRTNYWIHPYLNQLINDVRRNKSHEFCCIYLSIRLPDGGLHASIVLYDFNRNTIERFDPYGDTTLVDKELDDVLEEELTWNTGLSYLKANDYMSPVSFQTISDETNSKNIKLGDFGGFCLAWCLWYLEHRILNHNIDPKVLINKTLKKLFQQKLKFSEFIRNYANNINKNRYKVMKKVGIPEKRISDEKLSLQYELSIFEFIKKN